MSQSTASMAPVFSTEAPPVPILRERRHIDIGNDSYLPPITTMTSIGSSTRNILLAAATYSSMATITTLDIYSNLINHYEDTLSNNL